MAGVNPRGALSWLFPWKYPLQGFLHFGAGSMFFWVHLPRMRVCSWWGVGGVDQARGCSHPSANPKEVTMQLGRVRPPHPSAVAGSAPTPQRFPGPALQSPG